ncbi:uncharacterized protein LOC102674186 isoform X2 [Apis dorsata]|uniref:uncharacterized protein LOC102674186 isoform X2 n=1 Tax=Apis dorsata TaxID=7462 RepID=UPI00129330F3|nr:uncharacterized protein LOC102674186 isoform X2 [Apis dorsata]
MMMDVEETNTASTASSSPRPSSPAADSTFISVKREPSTEEPSSPLEATSPASILRNNNAMDHAKSQGTTDPLKIGGKGRACVTRKKFSP